MRGLAWFFGMIFLVLKLTGEISWSWWLVTAPFWIAFAPLTVLLLMLIAAGIFLITATNK